VFAEPRQSIAEAVSSDIGLPGRFEGSTKDLTDWSGRLPMLVREADRGKRPVFTPCGSCRREEGIVGNEAQFLDSVTR
jgi:hypothetical protein